MAIKITNADKWFAKCVKEAVNWTCECCGTKYEEGAQGLHCSHYFSRSNKRLRHEPDNANAHCFACHLKLGSNPHDFTAWKKRNLGEVRYDELMTKRNVLAKYNKALDAEIAAHYKDEHERMKKLREQGVTGEIKITGYW